MKPKDLKYPFHFEDRRPYLGEGILFVPAYYEAHAAFEMPPLYALFKNNNAIHVEYCSGNGLWICDRAAKHPDKNWIAVEKDFERVRKIYSKRHNHGLSNLFVVSGYAEPFATHYLRNESVQTAYINFPDPWPKDRHAKHRIVQAPFMKQVIRSLTGGGELHLVTDDVPYAEQMRAVMDSVPECALLQPDTILPEQHEYGVSWFERLWRSKGRAITHLHYQKEAARCLSK